MTTIEWLEIVDACGPDLEWAAAQPNQTPVALVAACPNGHWLLSLAKELGYTADALAAAARPAWLRAVREYAPAELDRAGQHDHATRLRALPDDVTPEAAAKALWAGAEAAWAQRTTEAAAQATRATQAAAWAAERAMRGKAWWAAGCAASAAEHAGLDPATEHARCADEVRAALPDLAARWADDLATTSEDG